MKGTAADRVMRFRLTERVLHWSLALPFMTCAATAFVLVLYYNPEPLRPGRELFSLIHRVSGICFLVLPVLTMLFGVRDWGTLWENVKEGWIWRLDDFKWLALTPLAIFRKDVQLPEEGKFNAGEKLNFVWTMTSHPLYGVTGLVIWLGPEIERISGITLEVGVLPWLVHFTLAVLSCGLIGGHLFMATINPASRAGLSGMFSGWVDRDWAAHHYRRWFKEKFPELSPAASPVVLDPELLLPIDAEDEDPLVPVTYAEVPEEEVPNAVPPLPLLIGKPLALPRIVTPLVGEQRTLSEDLIEGFFDATEEGPGALGRVPLVVGVDIATPAHPAMVHGALEQDQVEDALASVFGDDFEDATEVSPRQTPPPVAEEMVLELTPLSVPEHSSGIGERVQHAPITVLTGTARGAARAKPARPALATSYHPFTESMEKTRTFVVKGAKGVARGGIALTPATAFLVLILVGGSVVSGRYLLPAAGHGQRFVTRDVQLLSGPSQDSPPVQGGFLVRGMAVKEVGRLGEFSVVSSENGQVGCVATANLAATRPEFDFLSFATSACKRTPEEGGASRCKERARQKRGLCELDCQGDTCASCATGYASCVESCGRLGGAAEPIPSDAQDPSARRNQ